MDQSQPDDKKSPSATGASNTSTDDPTSAASIAEQMHGANPAIAAQLAQAQQQQSGDGKSKGKSADVGDAKSTKAKIKDMAQLLNGLSMHADKSKDDGKDARDMSTHKFWKTQPVPSFSEGGEPAIEEGPIKVIDKAKVPRDPPKMLEGFEWVTVDMMDEKQAEEVYELLTGHYVEDADAQFRFNYSVSFFNWALKSPGWLREWHVGVRASKSRKLVAFISAVPVQLRVRHTTLKASEVNFLCVHKKLRSKRLAPVLIQEITRRCYVEGTYQAIYTAGIVLPTPVSSCRYYHRSIDWLKLYEVGFCALPSNSTKARQITRNSLPDSTSTPGLRVMQPKDVPAVRALLDRYLKEFDMAPDFSDEEVAHWMLHDEQQVPEQVIWSYVVEDASRNNAITDFFSFYCLESSVINNKQHDNVRAAYLFYYATESKFRRDEKVLKDRLNQLMNDALVLAKESKFDVFNALTLLDNPLFLEQQKFGAGDGQLHYYLFNYRAAPVASGVDAKNRLDASKRGGVGVVML